MANTDPKFMTAFIGKVTEFADTTEATIFQGDASMDTIVDSIIVSTDDTSNKDIKIRIDDGTDLAESNYVTVQLPLSAGQTNSIAAFNLFTSDKFSMFLKLDSNGNKFLAVPAGWTIKAALAAAPTSGKKAWVTARGGKF